MSVASGKANLVDAGKALRQAWERAKGSWSDAAAERFLRDVIEPMEQRASAAARGIEDLDALIRLVRRECGNEAGGEGM